MYFYSISHNLESCYTPRFLKRRFALIATAYRYLDVSISVELISFVEMLLGDNKIIK